MKIGSKIKSIRMFRQYSQDYMAEKLGISQKAYSNIESDKADITLNTLEELATVLQVNICDILRFDKSKIFTAIFGASQHEANDLSMGSTSMDTFHATLLSLKKAEVALLKELLKKSEKKNKRQ